jgi:hypothetical protein
MKVPITVLMFREILVRIHIKIPGSVPLTNGSRSGSNSGLDFFLQWLKGANFFSSYFFLITYRGTHRHTIFSLKNLIFC